MNAYERDPYLARLDVRVLRLDSDATGAFAVLDDTVVYPEGGGQPADHGWLGDVRIVDAQRVDGDIRHYLDDAAESLRVDDVLELRLDWPRRYDHMQQHTAQHLLTAVAADEFGWHTTSFHLGAASSDIELDVEALDDDDLRRLEEAVAARARAALAVSARRVGRDEYAALAVRSRGLPADHSGDIRLVEIAGVDCNTCGGTHVRNTAEIGAIVLLHTEPMRGGVRLHWIAAERVARRLHLREQQAAAVRRLFETSDEGLLETAAGKLARLKDAEREVKGLQQRLAAEAAARLLALDEPVVDGHYDGADGAFLALLARRLLDVDGAPPALLTASGPSGDFFVLCAADEGIDARALGARVAELLDGRGGGTPELVQGKAGSLQQRGAAVELLRQARAARR